MVKRALVFHHFRIDAVDSTRCHRRTSSIIILQCFKFFFTVGEEEIQNPRRSNVKNAQNFKLEIRVVMNIGEVEF